MHIKLTCNNSFYKSVFFSQTPGQNGGRVLHEQKRQEVGRPRNRVERLQGEHRSFGKHFFQPSVKILWSLAVMLVKLYFLKL